MHGDVIRAPLTELHSMAASWPCSMWGMDVIGASDSPDSNGHQFILRNNIICRFGVPETLITDNTKNLIDGLYEQFKIRHRNSVIYRPQMNGVVETANKNLKKNIRKMTEAHWDWHEKLPYALMAYKTTVRTSTGATPYSLMHGMEVVLPAEVEIPSLRILMEAQTEETEWVRKLYEQLSLIDEKRLNAICHGQCYQRRMARANNRKVKPRLFEISDKVLKRILPMQEEAKGKFLQIGKDHSLLKKCCPEECLSL
ncbi:uncharacterized protein LOC113769161 [Coffea eugenioides]|uniref:uncharacterized protein LOC113769161 n=1 Tax=Coffea eugenioides TaxID=49369 RepID=UPI000F60ACF9|nr:uncharacterized protein LOC113769161 [Coffea eugenioides]